jgi:hypothetical protein
MFATVRAVEQMFESLVQWATREDAQTVCGVEQRSFRVQDAMGQEFEIRGLAVVRDFVPCEVVLRVPAACFLSAANAQRHLKPLDDLLRVMAVAADAYREGTTDHLTSSGSSSDDERSHAQRLRSCGKQSIGADGERAKFVRGLARDHEFALAVALCLLRHDARTQPGGAWHTPTLVPFLAFVASLPSRDEMTNVDFWSAEDVDHLGSTARRAKCRRRIDGKLPARFAKLESVVFQRFPQFFDARVFTAEHWWWAIHTLGSRCFNYTPREGDAAPPTGEGTDGHRRPGIARRKRRRDARGPKPAAESSDDDFILPAYRGKKRSASTIDEALAAAHAADSTSSSSSESGTSADSSEDEATSSDDESPKEDRETFTMVPLADLCNHDDGGDTCDFEYDANVDAMVFTATKAMRTGEQMMIRYNGMDTWKFAKYYGFVPPAAKPSVDCFPIAPPPLAPPEAVPRPASAKAYGTRTAVLDDIATATKRQLFSDEGGGKKLLGNCHVTAKGPNAKLLGVMRLRFMSRDEMAHYPRAFLPSMLSAKNEWQAYAAMVTEIDKALADIKAAVSAQRPIVGARSAVAMYYGTTKEEVARRAILDAELKALRERRGAGDATDPTAAAARRWSLLNRPLSSDVQLAAEAAIAECAPAWRSRTTTNPSTHNTEPS